MSGIDERVIDFPRCQHCDDFHFWRTLIGEIGVIYYEPIGFVESKEAHVTIYINAEPCHPDSVCEHLAFVNNIDCYACGAIPANGVYKKILRMARVILRCPEGMRDLKGKDLFYVH